MINDEKFMASLQSEINKLPYTKHLDDGQYNDGVITGFELGAEWAYYRPNQNLYTEEQMREAFILGMEASSKYSPKATFESFVQSIKEGCNNE